MDDEHISYNQEDLTRHHGVAAIIKDSTDKILVQDHVKYGFLTIPVGKVSLGADIVKGLSDELFEECGIHITAWRELATREYEYLREGRLVHLDAHLFEITQYRGTIENKEPHKHRKQWFATVEEITAHPYLSDLTLLYLETLGIKRKARL